MNLLAKVNVEKQKIVIKKKAGFEKMIASPDLLHNVTNKLGVSPRSTNLNSFPLSQNKKRKLPRQASLNSILEVKSGWSSRADSQMSLSETDLIEELDDELQEYIEEQKNKDLLNLKDKLVKQMSDSEYCPTQEELDIKICSAHYMYNMVMNNSNSILFIDTRPLIHILRGYIDHNHKQDNNIPMPSDYLLEKDLKMKDYKHWVPNVLFKDENMNKYNLVNKEKLTAFNGIKRKYVFIIASHQ